MGEDSYVVLRNLPYKRVREAAALSERAMGSAEEQDHFIRALIADGVVDWNWVDWEGEPLPLPSEVEDFDEIGLLTEEVSFLLGHLIGEAGRKN
jgi:hypothetical protein